MRNIIIIKIENNFSYLAKKYLLVLRLRINLILAKQLYKNKIIRMYNLKNIYFKKLKNTM